MNIKILLGITALLLHMCSNLALAANWNAKTFESGAFTLPYEIYQPEGHDKLPLIIHLHGTGEAGTDNKAQLYIGKNIGPEYFSSDKIQSIQKAIILAPQTPKDMRWANSTLDPYDFKTTPSTLSMTALLELIDKLIATNPNIDSSRIYMTGLSRGGQGVWNAAMQRPELFAAIVPIAGSGSPADASLLVKIPTWAFHGSNDSVTNVNYTRDIVDAIIRSGGTTRLLRYTEIEGGEHPDSWLTAFKDDRLYRWMLSHHR
jgi:predicted peptidase